tara:strand:+ start:419 stop:1309 length:891 start_codon:yes stop_codon:yes gene_type:complete
MTVFRLYNGSIMKEELEKYHKEEHAKRYGTNAEYKKSSFNLGWRIQPKTSTKGRKKYKWGKDSSVHPNNLANPFTKNVPALIDFLETKEPRFLFYTLEDWDMNSKIDLSVESEIISRAVLYWRLMIFTNQYDQNETKKVKYFLKTVSIICEKKFKQNGIKLYSDGIIHSFTNDSFELNLNPFNKIIFIKTYNKFLSEIKTYYRESKSMNQNEKKKYWIKVFSSLIKNFQKKFLKIFDKININKIQDIVIIYFYISHNSLIKDKNISVDFNMFYDLVVNQNILISKEISNISVTLIN